MQSPARITTIDLLKFAGLAFVFVDHIGLFFAPDQDWWRVFGRIAAPIFFFLIGFAKSGAVPLRWLALGAVLTALDAYASEGIDGVTLNILFNFALIRLAMPLIETQFLPRWWGLTALALFSAAMIKPVSIFLEYGAEGWLWALFGLAAREALARTSAAEAVSAQGLVAARLQRNLVAIFCASVYVIAETRDFEFHKAQTIALAVLVTALSLTLLVFRRGDAHFSAPAPVVAAFNWIGRHSLEIYAVSLFLMQLTGHLIEANDDET